MFDFDLAAFIRMFIGGYRGESVTVKLRYCESAQQTQCFIIGADGEMIDAAAW